jgi:dTDP-L-rhamnose 4-epimerase
LRQGLEQSGMEHAILRLQNVYGAGQSLHNPYTGVLSIFVQQLLAGNTLNIYEDGEIVRDFVYVSDVVAAFHRLCEVERVPNETVDIGSGVGSTILEVAQTMICELGIEGDRLKVTGQFRPGDVRSAVADISTAKLTLGWTPKISLTEGINRLVSWACDVK